MTDEQAERGQTTLDYTIAILVFIAVVLFVFLFVPGILEPFEGGDGEDPAVADRIGNTVSDDLLSGPDQPRALDRQCTVEFFKDAGSEVSRPECEFTAGQNLTERLNLGLTRVNITVQGNWTGTYQPSETLCWDAGDNEWTKADETDCDPSGSPLDTPLKIGSNTPQNSAATITSTRVVSLQGRPVTLVVRVW